MVKRKKPALTLRKAKQLAQHMLVSGLLIRAIAAEIERRGLVPNAQFRAIIAANDIDKKLQGMLPQLGLSFKDDDWTLPYTLYWGASAPFILATPTILAEAKAEALKLSDDVYTSLTTIEVAPEVAP